MQLLLMELQGDVWIGLHDQQKEEEYVWVDGSRVNFVNWKSGEPSGSKHVEEDCTEMLFVVNQEDIGKWNDNKCSEEKDFICQKDQMKLLTVNLPLDPMICSKENPSGFKFQNSCYNLVRETKTWKEAEAHCKSEYFGHLVAVRTFYIALFLDYMLKGFNRDIWIGLSLVDGVRQEWASGFFVGYNGWGGSKRRFTKGLCATRVGKHQWSLANCQARFAFVCEQTTDTPPVLTQTIKDAVCPPQPDDWIDLGGDKCYFFEVNTEFVWYEANFMCILRGGYLLSLHSNDESDVLHEFIFATQGELHIGLHRELQDGKGFAWSDRSKLDWTNWEPSKPDGNNQKCCQLRKDNMKWNNIFCNQTRGYICSVKKIVPLANLTVLHKISQEKYRNFISYNTLTAFLGSTLFAVLVLLGIILSCRLKPWIRKQHSKNVNCTEQEHKDISEQYEMK